MGCYKPRGQHQDPEEMDVDQEEEEEDLEGREDDVDAQRAGCEEEEPQEEEEEEAEDGSSRQVKVLLKALRKPVYQPISRNEVLSAARDCFLFHRLDEARDMVNVSLNYPQTPHDFYFKAGFMLFESFEATNSGRSSEALMRFVSSLLTLDVNRREVVLETILFLAKKRGLDVAKAFRSRHQKNLAKKSLRNNGIIDNTFKCYSEYLECISWQREVDQNSEYAFFNDSLKQRALKSVATFESVILSSRGQWDIFLLMALKVLCFYGNIEEARDLLAEYKEKNSDHLTANMLLFKFADKHAFQDSMETKADCFEKIVCQSPSDQLVLRVCEKKEEVVTNLDSAKILMEFVDYYQNKHSLRAWRSLVQSIKSIDPLGAEFKHLQVHYTQMHSSYWESYHFDQSLSATASVSETEEAELIFYKSMFISYFATPSHPYIEGALNVLSKFSKLKHKLEARLRGM